MGRCYPGDQIFLKIKGARNCFKLNGSVDLVIMKPTQLVWVQMDVGRKRYCILFKMTNNQKKGMLTIQSVRMMTWHVRMTCGRTDCATHGIHWLRDVVE
jgi:hypothetical protein